MVKIDHLTPKLAIQQLCQLSHGQFNYHKPNPDHSTHNLGHLVTKKTIVLVLLQSERERGAKRKEKVYIKTHFAKLQFYYMLQLVVVLASIKLVLASTIPFKQTKTKIGTTLNMISNVFCQGSFYQNSFSPDGKLSECTQLLFVYILFVLFL